MIIITPRFKTAEPRGKNNNKNKNKSASNAVTAITAMRVIVGMGYDMTLMYVLGTVPRHGGMIDGIHATAYGTTGYCTTVRGMAGSVL